MVFDLDVNARGRVLACETDVDIAGTLEEQLVELLLLQPYGQMTRCVSRLKIETAPCCDSTRGFRGEQRRPCTSRNLSGTTHIGLTRRTARQTIAARAFDSSTRRIRLVHCAQWWRQAELAP